MIAFIGAGNMGGAILRGMLRRGCSSENFVVIDKSEAVCNSFAELGVKHSESLSNAEIAIVAVKPWHKESVRNILKGFTGTIVSVMAGVGLEELSELYESEKVAQVIPNTAVELGSGVSFIASKDNALAQEVQGIFSRVGVATIVEPHAINEYMILGSCGLAFALRYARAAMVSGIALGVKPAEAQSIVAGILRGAADMLESGEHPESLIDKITTPGGVTIKGLEAMENKGFSSAVLAAHKINL